MYGNLHSVIALTGTSTGPWRQVQKDERTHCAMQASVTAGTATITFEGRISPSDSPVTIYSATGTDGVMGAKFPQMRAVISAATGATVVVSVDAVLK